ncbi:MAG: hypothetical protein ACSLEM_00390 [Candidatus Malihini olakiniferum]
MRVAQSEININISNIIIQDKKAILKFNLTAIDISILRYLLSVDLANQADDFKHLNR